MPDQKPTLEYAGPPPKRERSIIYDVVRGLRFAYLVALAVLGFLWLLGFAIRSL